MKFHCSHQLLRKSTSICCVFYIFYNFIIVIRWRQNNNIFWMKLMNVESDLKIKIEKLAGHDLKLFQSGYLRTRKEAINVCHVAGLAQTSNGLGMAIAYRLPSTCTRYKVFSSPFPLTLDKRYIDKFKRVQCYH